MANVFDNPSDNVYDAYGKAVAAGQLYNDTLRRNTAFNALSKAYGPEVGDIKLATDAQALHQSKTMDPLLTQQQSLTNAGLQIKNEGSTETNAFNKANNPALVANNQTVAATNQDQLAQSQQLQKAKLVHGALSGAISSLGTQLNGVTDPNQRLALFDQQIDQLAPQLGVDGEGLKHELAQQRAAIATQGTAALPQIQQQIDALVSSQLSPSDRAALGIASTNADIAQTNLQKAQAQADLAKTKADQAATGKGQTPAQLMKQQAAMAGDQQALSSFDSTVDNIAADGGAIDQAIQFIKDNPDSTGLVGGALSGLGKVTQGIIGGGTPANDLAQLLLPITSNQLLENLQDLKKSSANGSSGFGSLSNTEGETLKSSVASVNQSQSGTQLIAGLMKMKGAMQQSRQRLKAHYVTVYGADPDAPVKAPTTVAAPPAAGAPPATYDGDPALWQYLSPEDQKLWQ